MKYFKKFIARPTLLSLGIALFLVFVPAAQVSAQSMRPETPLWDVLERLGEPPAKHQLGRKPRTAQSIEKGRKIFFDKNVLKPRQSEFFNCVDCHNVTREDPDLSKSDPDARLSYLWRSGRNKKPLLQGTTMAGIVNRTKFYNGIYKKKYGGVTERAENDLIEAVQVCAEYCSQGRRLNDAELEAVMAYLWSLQWRMKDMGVNSANIGAISRRMADSSQHTVLRSQIKSRFLTASPATLGEVKSIGPASSLVGDPVNGRIVYEMSCLHCHSKDPNAPGYQLSMAALLRGFDGGKVQDIIRNGLDPKDGVKEHYMPYYTKERMSDQQIADLRAYVSERVAGNEVELPGASK